MSITGRLDSRLLHAYRSAHYRVDDPEGEFTLRVGIFNPQLAQCHGRYQAEHSAFITACNPRGQQRTGQENSAASALLVERVARLGFPWIPGVGLDPDGKWPGEKSMLILGISQEVAAELAREFEQNAIIVNGQDAIPALLVL